MNRRAFTALAPGIAVSLISEGVSNAQTQSTIKLPSPQFDRGRPLMQVLKDRQTIRAFKPEVLSPQDLSNVLWAAWGVNRTDGKRTAPSWANFQEIEIYVALNTGVYRYDALPHSLGQVMAQDVRASIQRTPPVGFVFVADFSKMRASSDEEKRFIAGTDVGFISQNIYLYCASEGLATVVLGGIDRAAMQKTLNLPDTKQVIHAQALGYKTT